jgi:hypothetical protein
LITIAWSGNGEGERVGVEAERAVELELGVGVAVKTVDAVTLGVPLGGGVAERVWVGLAVEGALALGDAVMEVVDVGVGVAVEVPVGDGVGVPVDLPWACARKAPRKQSWIKISPAINTGRAGLQRRIYRVMHAPRRPVQDGTSVL